MNVHVSRIARIITVLLIALMLIGCGRYAAAQGDLTDPEISAAVERKLRRDEATPADHIDVATVSGIVTLGGSVPNILARERAGTLAETVKGVTGVINRIDVSAPFRSDAAIAADVEQALASDPATAALDVAVSVRDGTVTLAGSAASWQVQSLAARVAKGVRGVKDVKNDLAVAFAVGRSDAEIRRDVESALRWYAYVDAADIDVAVDDGRVTLSGSVASMAEKSLAKAVSWVAGVTAVDNSGLEVDWAARKAQRRQDVYTARTPAEIEAAVVQALESDPRVDAARVSVTVDDGIATLTGAVGDLKAKRAAAMDADNVVGVQAVDNQLAVAPPAPPNDAQIEARVEEALMRDPYVDRYNLTVDVSGGEVYLSGEVETQFAKGLADDLAARQPGVTRVYNNLVVEAPGAGAYNPYADEYNIRAYEWYEAPNAPPGPETDFEIERGVRQELFWSPFVESEDIEVTVTNGVVRLTGTVDSWSERDAAEQSALEGGARAVDNDLAIDRNIGDEQAY